MQSSTVKWWGLSASVAYALVMTPPIHASWRQAQAEARAEYAAERPASVHRRALSQAGELRRVVYGYLPYWEMPYEVPHWELLTVLAWFGVEIDEAGKVLKNNGWGGAETQSLVDTAHANDTLVVPTIILFDNEGIANLLSSPQARAQTIETCLELMALHGADGVNIDFEFVPGSVKAEFVTFMADLTDAVREVAPNGGPGHVTLAGPAVDWTGGYDYDELLAATDGIMVMGYGYHYSDGPPGPNAPLFGGGIWGPYSVAWTIDDYFTYGGDAYRERIFFGLPWYGRRWPVASEEVPGEALGSGKAVWFDVALEESEQYGASYDSDSHTPYYHKVMEGQLWQVWFDDPDSFGEKLAYIDAQGLGGIGLWALGYEGAAGAYWDEIAEHLTYQLEEPEEPEEPFEDVSDSAPSSAEPESAEPAIGDAHAEVEETLEPDTQEGPETVGPDPDPPEIVNTRVEVGLVSQSALVEDTSLQGCAGGGGTHPAKWWALIVGMSAIVALRRERAG